MPAKSKAQQRRVADTPSAPTGKPAAHPHRNLGKFLHKRKDTESHSYDFRTRK